MFKTGDLVRLRCGGPVMVVDSFKPAHKYTPSWIAMGVPDPEKEIEVPDKYLCLWFDTENKLQFNQFAPELLVNVDGSAADIPSLKSYNATRIPRSEWDR